MISPRLIDQSGDGIGAWLDFVPVDVAGKCDVRCTSRRVVVREFRAPRCIRVARHAGLCHADRINFTGRQRPQHALRHAIAYRVAVASWFAAFASALAAVL